MRAIKDKHVELRYCSVPFGEVKVDESVGVATELLGEIVAAGTRDGGTVLA